MKIASGHKFLAKFDKKLAEITPENCVAAIEAANELRAAGEIEGVNIRGFVDQSLEAMTKLVPMKRVHLQLCRDIDIAPLYAQTELEMLAVSPDPIPVDLSRFESLLRLSVVWHPKSAGLSALRRIERIALWKLGPAFKDIASLRLPAGIRELSLTQSNLASLSGIGALGKLESLELSHLRAKLDIASLPEARALLSASFGQMQKHQNIEAIGQTTTLERLNFESCGDIESLGWMRSLQHLRQFVFLGTKVGDRDLSVLTKLPKLEVFSADYRRDYEPPIKVLESLLTARVIT